MAAVRLLAWSWALGPGSGGLLGARAVVVEGKLPEERNFAQLLVKFCYDFIPDEAKDVGVVTLDLIPLESMALDQPASGRLLFMLFDDENNHWKKVQREWETSTCEEKIQASSDTVEAVLASDKEETTYLVRIREKVRPRFWYFALVACDMQMSTPVRYRIHTQNEKWGWQSEFSLDHMGLFILYAVFTVAFGVATAATAYASRWQSGPDQPPLREHPYLSLLLLSYSASLVSSALFLTHYALFIRDGCGSKRLRFLAVTASVVANCTIFLIAILSSNGWAISNFMMPYRRCFLGLVSFTGGLSALCELGAETAVEQSTKLYSYQSGPGVLAVILKLFIFCWFAYQMKSTYDEEIHGRLKKFYKCLGISLTGWSLNVPITVLLALQLSPWVRYKIVITVEVTARFVGQLLLSHLLCGPLSPIMAENIFPSGRMPVEMGFGELGSGNG